MAELKSILAREILDSRGFPTLEVDVILSSGLMGRASVPSGASKGSHEALELRDGGSRYGGKGVRKAIAQVVEISAALFEYDVRYQKAIDEKLIALDGTPDKSRLGANTLLAVSIACARAAAKAVHRPLFEYLQNDPDNHPACCLPLPLINIINGGAHANNGLDIQEFMIVPVGAPCFSEALRYASEVFHALKALLSAKGLSTAVGDEGGFAPLLHAHEEALDIILEAIHQAGFKAGRDIVLALDLASTAFFDKGHYSLPLQKQGFSTDAWINYLQGLVRQYPIISLEDAMAEEDWEGWKDLTQALGTSVQLVGDDLFVTDCNRLFRGISEKSANAVLIKPNQIGTLSETRAALEMAKVAGFETIISHRSGETEDTFIADLTVACHVQQIKTGSVSRGERTAKYNQLLRIEEMLGNNPSFAGWSPFKKFKQYDALS
ncbi:MAG: phosphopyruvate hydratase [Gammaproteobacteria bacterium]|nr:phosphopyruvate hydratase [Gammaproteobacteria bacterium]MBP9729595.1 phosphopyruvate hydratase [Gammaproteobacteria bacterium]